MQPQRANVEMRRVTRPAAFVLALALCAEALAQPSPPPEEDALPALGEYLDAMAEARLLASETGSGEVLRRLLGEGDQAYLEGRYDEAVVLLLEIVESPRFRDFGELTEYAAAESMLAAALLELGSLSTARRYLERVLARGPEHPYFGPSVRRFTDSALLLGDPGPAAERLVAAAPELERDADAKNELAYLRGRDRYDAADDAGAIQFLSQITKQSRFYANARYLMGAIAARNKRWKEAESRFCEVAGTGEDDHYAFYVDDRYFEVRDLSRLGLGRVAHEELRADDAFYYYFQVPQDSPRLAEAFFEAAYASYEGNEYDTAVDLLDQLETRFPRSPFIDEASILRGYVALSRCEFEEADRRFARFIDRFGPMIDEVDRILENPARQERLYAELLEAARAPAQTPEEAAASALDQRRLLLSLLRADPDFYRLHAELQNLDAEAARAARSDQALEVILARLRGSDRPRAAASEAAEAAALRETLEREIDDGRASTDALSRQLDAMRRARAPHKELAAIERELGKAARELQSIRRRLRLIALAAPGEVGGAGASGGSKLEGLLEKDVAQARRLPADVAAMRDKLVAAANARGLAALRELRTRLAERMGRARIGRIDAIMGSKRRIEIQIESLAAGRFPAELRDPLMVQGLLYDDEEYWPFEGEDWPDEYEENFGADGEGQE